ncbi:MAG: hypothetical protein Tsb0013_18430 [Phycisphaerales bacterium]
MFAWTRPLTDRQYRAEHPIGLASLARTLHHIKGAEHAYAIRLRGVTDTPPTPAHENDPEPTTDNALPFPELESSWRTQQDDVRALIDSINDWHTPRVYTTVWEGKPYAYRATNADLLAQLVLHEIHHRAQVMHMLTRSDVQTGEIDYNALMWEPQ